MLKYRQQQRQERVVCGKPNRERPVAERGTDSADEYIFELRTEPLCGVGCDGCARYGAWVRLGSHLQSKARASRLGTKVVSRVSRPFRTRGFFIFLFFIFCNTIRR